VRTFSGKFVFLRGVSPDCHTSLVALLVPATRAAREPLDVDRHRAPAEGSRLLVEGALGLGDHLVQFERKQLLCHTIQETCERRRTEWRPLLRGVGWVGHASILAMIAFSPEAGKAVDGVMPPSITGNTRLMNTPGAGPSGPSMKDWNSSALKGWEASQMQNISSCGMKRRASADARAVAVRCRSGPCARCRSGGSNGCGRRWRDS